MQSRRSYSRESGWGEDWVVFHGGCCWLVFRGAVVNWAHRLTRPEVLKVLRVEEIPT
jgi:hypothetical protein